MPPNFLANYNTLLQRVADINPLEYARTRNYLNGSVTYLSPFLTHGIISTATVARIVLDKYTSDDAEKLLSELAWREYFHRTWQVNDNDIFRDLKHPQTPVDSHKVPSAIANASTSIETIDNAIKALKNTGYMHNHVRMWVAAISCNTGRTHWHQPARWLYYHLLDGDLASNSLSWQWVAGSFSHRKYIANQENLNLYSQSTQRGTFLDLEYEELSDYTVPEVLKLRTDIELTNDFPKTTAEPVCGGEPVFLYSIWNLDPTWRRGLKGRRILWIDPELHREFALSPLRWRFIVHWANCIDGLKIFVGNQDALFPKGVDHLEVYKREYPATKHWPGQQEEREWCYATPAEPLKSFSNYWKQVRKLSNYFVE